MTDHYLATPAYYVDTAVSVELSTPSLTHEWLHNGLIFRTTLHDNSRHTVDQYANRWLEIIGSAPTSQTMLFVLDISKVSFTIYGRSRSLELTRFRRNIKGYVAIVEKNNLEAQFSQMIVRTMDRETSNVRLRMFYAMDEALDWVTQMGELHQPNAD